MAIIYMTYQFRRSRGRSRRIEVRWGEGVKQMKPKYNTHFYLQAKEENIDNKLR